MSSAIRLLHTLPGMTLAQRAKLLGAARGNRPIGEFVRPDGSKDFVFADDPETEIVALCRIADRKAEEEGFTYVTTIIHAAE